MAQLLKNIQGSLLDNFTSNITLVNSISGEIQREDYINLNGLIGFLQNLSRAEDTALLTKPLIYGLKNYKNLPIKTLNIDY